MTRTLTQSRLRAGVAPLALLFAFAGTAAYAQDATAPAAGDQTQAATASPQATVTDQAAPAGQTADQQPQEIVVTGSLFRRADTETPSPVTVLRADDLAKRGVTTIADAVNTLAANGAGTLPSAFSANGAFAGGASAVSLRGLTTDSTVVLFDGLRGAPYPLADDGTRSFTDLNTIPDAIVDRVDVLKDGASATYGADAIAGVVNVILKREIKGLYGDASAGVTSRGDAGEQRLSLTGGYGDLDEQGFNVYVSGEYQHNEMLMNNKRGFPFNTSDLSSGTADDGSTPLANNNQNGQGVTPSQATISAIVRPATLNVPGDIYSGAAIAGGQTMILNPAGCAQGTIFGSNAGGDYCEQDLVNQYGVIQPAQTRLGVTGHATVKLGDDTEAYLVGTYYQNKVSFINAPSGTNSRQPQTLRNIVLPALLADGSINPQDPYANIIDPATGQRESALLQYRFGGINSSTEDFTRTFRIAGGVKGSFGEGWGYSLDGTYMHTKLDITQKGLISYNALEDAITTGSYNFIDPSQNTQAQLDALSPTLKAKATSTLWQAQGIVTKELAQLPGGPLQVAVGGQVRYEKINDPVQDPLDSDGNYVFAGVNTFSAVGHRYNEAAFFEINAPVIDKLELDVSGRYDHYSSGFSHFSPKVGAKFEIIPQIAIRGTYSRGFRAPSIPESSGNVIGYTTTTPPESVIKQHCAAGTSGDSCVPNGYVAAYGIGYFNVGNPDLKPETSENYTIGTIIQPTRWLSFTADYYHIKKKNLIIGGPDASTAIANYYATGDVNSVPAGYSLELNPADPEHPDAIRTVQVVNSQYINAQSAVVSGLDFSMQANAHLSDDVQFTSLIDANYVLKYNIYTSEGVQKFAGTLGPYNYTSGAGTPRWRGSWQNTLTFGKFSLTGTAYYTQGYTDAADDATGAGTAHGPDKCDAAAQLAVASDGVTPAQCHVPHFIDVDLTASVQAADNFQLYANVLNVFDAKAPFDPAQYSGNNYNPAYAGQGVVGRFIRVGAKFNF